MKNKIQFLIACSLLFLSFANAQIGIGTTTPDLSSILDISSTTKGLLLPRLSATEIAAIPLPAKGLLIFNTSNNQVVYNSGSTIAPSWTTTTASNGLTATSGDIKLGGVLTASTTISGVTAINKLIVTATGIDAINLASNTLSIDATNNRVGIGTSVPAGKLHLYEEIGSTLNNLNGTLILEHGNTGGQSSILFRSKVNLSSDFGYIKYSDDDSGNGSTDQNSLLEIGVQNDGVGAANQDDIALMPSGNVGVGTKSPDSKLEVAGEIIVRSSDGAGNTIGGSARLDPGSNTTSGYLEIFNSSNNRLGYIGQDNTHLTYVTQGGANHVFSGGNVGIGTASPTVALDVVGQVKISGGTPGANKVLTSNSTGVGSWTNLSSLGITTASNGLTAASGDVKLGGVLTASTTISGVSATNKLSIIATGIDAINLASSTLSIDATNNRVGIGVTNPSHPLVLTRGISSLAGSVYTPSNNFLSRHIANGFGAYLSLESYQTSQQPGVITFKANGTFAAPTAVLDGELLSLWIARSYSGSTVLDNTGGFDIMADGADHTPTSAPTKINFNTTSVGSVTSDVRLTIKNNGDVGIGTTTPATKLDIAGSVSLRNDNSSLTVDSGTDSRLGLVKKAGSVPVIATGLDNPMIFGSWSTANLIGNIASGTFTEKVRIETNGRVGIGTNSPSALLSVNGGANKTGGANWANFSDLRVKKDIVNYTKGLKEIMNIRPVSFKYNGKGAYEADGITYVGVIAQEIEKILPSTVTKIKLKEFDDLRQYDSSELTYTLINAIKELKAEVDILKADLKK